MASLLESIISDTVAEFKINVTQKLKENNTIPVNLGDPPQKRFLSYPIHRCIFAKAFGCTFTPAERVVGSSCFFSIPSLNRIEEIFGCRGLVRFNHFGDMAVISPVLKAVNSNILIDSGDFLFPIEMIGERIIAFLPSGCDDEDGNKMIIKPL